MIIYIIGYGRSGSTRLAQPLEKKLNAINLGELKYLYRDDKDDLIEPYWAKFKSDNKKLLGEKDLFKFDNVIGFLRWNRRKKFKELWDAIFKRIGVDPDKDILIDSSKSNLDAFMRGIYLYYSYPDVVFIKPDRSYIEIFKSLLKGKNSDLERGLRKGKAMRLLHTLAVGLPHLLITELLSYIYRIYGFDTLDLEDIEFETDRFIQKHNIQKSPLQKDIPMFYGNRSRINTS